MARGGGGRRASPRYSSGGGWGVPRPDPALRRSQRLLPSWSLLEEDVPSRRPLGSSRSLEEGAFSTGGEMLEHRGAVNAPGAGSGAAPVMAAAGPYPDTRCGDGNGTVAGDVSSAEVVGIESNAKTETASDLVLPSQPTACVAVELEEGRLAPVYARDLGQVGSGGEDMEDGEPLGCSSPCSPLEEGEVSAGGMDAPVRHASAPATRKHVHPMLEASPRTPSAAHRIASGCWNEASGCNPAQGCSCTSDVRQNALRLNSGPPGAVAHLEILPTTGNMHSCSEAGDKEQCFGVKFGNDFGAKAGLGAMTGTETVLASVSSSLTPARDDVAVANASGGEVPVHPDIREVFPAAARCMVQNESSWEATARGIDPVHHVNVTMEAPHADELPTSSLLMVLAYDGVAAVDDPGVEGPALVNDPGVEVLARDGTYALAALSLLTARDAQPASIVCGVEVPAYDGAAAVDDPSVEGPALVNDPGVEVPARDGTSNLAALSPLTARDAQPASIVCGMEVLARDGASSLAGVCMPAGHIAVHVKEVRAAASLPADGCVMEGDVPYSLPADGMSIGRDTIGGSKGGDVWV